MDEASALSYLLGAGGVAAILALAVREKRRKSDAARTQEEAAESLEVVVAEQADDSSHLPQEFYRGHIELALPCSKQWDWEMEVNPDWGELTAHIVAELVDARFWKMGMVDDEVYGKVEEQIEESGKPDEIIDFNSVRLYLASKPLKQEAEYIGGGSIRTGRTPHFSIQLPSERLRDLAMIHSEPRAIQDAAAERLALLLSEAGVDDKGLIHALCQRPSPMSVSLFIHKLWRENEHDSVAPSYRAAVYDLKVGPLIEL